VEDVKRLSHNKDIPADDVLELIKAFGQTWFSLDAFDKQTFNPSKQTAKKIKLEGKKLYDDILKLKQNLIQQHQTTDLFAQEKEAGSLEGIFGNIFQSAFGKDVYTSVESKAAHLLYFIIKNHPFTDGNKRSGAFAFVRFLQKVGYDFRAKITPEALTTMALLVATSDPKDKQRIVDLVILLLGTNK
jgi:death-on-curing family protein